MLYILMIDRNQLLLTKEEGMWIEVEGIRINMAAVAAYQVAPGADSGVIKIELIGGKSIVIGYRAAIIKRLDELLIFEKLD